jgi:AcrR family transcriptional regulator
VGAVQKRAEATRDSVLSGAAGVFYRDGFAKAALQEIIEKAGVTKGSLYFHFSSKEQLARAVVDEGFARLDVACARQFGSHRPALETLIGISYVLVDPAINDEVMLAAFRLFNEMGDHSGGSCQAIFDRWTATYRDLAIRAVSEGDFRDGIDPIEAGRLLLDLTFGARLLAVATDTTTEL